MEKKKSEKLDLIYEKMSAKVVDRVLLEPESFYGCKTIEDVLMNMGCDVWGKILYEVGYSSRFYVTEIVNLSPRFCRLFDKVAEKFDASNFMEKIMKLVYGQR